MNRSLLKRFFPQALAWTAAVALCGAMALAQQNSSTAAARSDGQIEMDVVQALDASTALKNDLITAATIQSEVTLAGTVSTESSRELAEGIASRVPGVTKVNNNLKVGNPQAAASDTGAQQQEDESESAAAPAQGDAPYTDEDQAQSQAPQTPNTQPQYVPARPPVQAYKAPKGPVTISPGTLLQLRTSEPVNSKNAANGTPVQFMVIQDVAVDGVLAIPRGAIVHGVVSQVTNTKSGDLGGSAKLALVLTSLDLGNQSYPLYTDQFKVKGPDKAGRTVGNAFGGAILGAILGGGIGRGEGAAIGAGVGATAGVAASAASSGPGVWIPSEALVDFHLKAALTVTPVNAQEAARLSQGLYPGGPTLYQRNYPGYPYGHPYYAYPPVSYRPYYVVGGDYYWR